MVNLLEGRLPQQVLESPEPDHFHPFAEEGLFAVKCWITTDKRDAEKHAVETLY